MKKFLLIVGIYAVLNACIYAIVFVCIPFIKDESAYSEAKQWDTASFYFDYVTAFPEGRHVDEAWRMILHNARTHDLEHLIYYLDNYPDGKYYDAMQKRYDDIWKSVIAEYQKQMGENASETMEAFLKMLCYMQDNRLCFIVMNVNWEYEVKDLDSYDHSVIDYVESQNAYPISITDNFVGFSPESDYKRGSCFEDRVSSRITEVFDSHLIYVYEEESGSWLLEEGIVNEENLAKAPSIDINLVVMNSEYSYKSMQVPEMMIFKYDDENSYFLMNIAVRYEAKFVIPGDENVASITGSHKAELSGKDVRDTEQAYSNMLYDCSSKVAEDVANGIMTIAKKEEEDAVY